MLNILAWILATCEDAEIRDGAQAVRLAERAYQLADQGNYMYLDTLAAAYAEAGQFDHAVKTAQRAVKLARNGTNQESAEDIQGRLELYRAKRAYRESFSPEAPTRR